MREGAADERPEEEEEEVEEEEEPAAEAEARRLVDLPAPIESEWVA